MCIIMVKPKGIVMPNDDLLTKLYNANPDGAGVAYTCKKSIYMKKGFMTLKSFLDFCHKIPNSKDRDVVVHCRISTGGKTDNLNCHPYPMWHKNNVEGYYECVLFHNGMLNSLGYHGDDKINDTQQFKNEVLNKMSRNFFIHHDVWTMLDEIVTNTGSKLVFLDAKYGIQIINREAFKEKDGLLFSNLNWEHTYSYIPHSYSSHHHYCFDDYDDDYYSWNNPIVGKHNDIADDYGEDEIADENLAKLDKAFDGLCDFDSDGFETYLLLFYDEEAYDLGYEVARKLDGFDFVYDKAECCMYATPIKDKFVDKGSINLFK